jgi:AhpD family alkylhydroperoxidase
MLTGTPARATALLGQALGLLPKLVDMAAIWGEQRLDPKLREEVMLAVAQANACRLCTMAQRRWALAEGVTDAELAALEQHDQARCDRRTWAALAWADARARAGLGPVADEFERELARYYSKAERDDLDVVTRVMTIANQLGQRVRRAA